MYISSEVVKTSLNRLKSNAESGKSHQEKTSSLMYFLAFDALAKRKDKTLIEFPPKAFARKEMALEYAKLVLLNKDGNGNTQQIVELGLVEINGRQPEKRISSNFYTVPLKNASDISGGDNYPNRPAPILRLGNVSDKVKWGITYHAGWKINFPKFFSEIRSNTPFTDLAIFICRNDFFANNISEWEKALYFILNTCFTDKLSSYWSDKINDEKRFAKHISNDMFFASKQQNIDLKPCLSRNEALRGLDKAKLIARVEYLETILDNNAIAYNI
jgi:hypothetical protein